MKTKMKNINILYKFLRKSFNILIYASLLGFILSLIVFFRIDWPKSFLETNSNIYDENSYTVINNATDLEVMDLMDNDDTEKSFKRLSFMNDFNFEYNQNLFEKIYLERTKCIFNMKLNNEHSNGNEDCKLFYKNGYLENSKNFCGNDEWINYKSTCVKLSDSETTWIDAKLDCDQSKSNLLFINNTDIENANLISKIVLNPEFNLGSSVFLGLYRSLNYNKIRKYGNSWMWTTGEYLNFSNWNFNEPSGIYDCSELIVSSNDSLDSIGKWNTINCDKSKRNFFCLKNVNIDMKYHVDDSVFTYLKYLTINQTNLNDFLVQLYHLTIKESYTFSFSQIVNIIRILNKAANFNYVSLNTAKSFFNTISNILNSDENLFRNNPKLMNNIIRTINKFILKIRLNTKKTITNEFKFSNQNLIITIKDVFVNEVSKDKASKIILDDQDNVAVVVHTKFQQSIISYRNKYRLSIIYFKNKKIFQSSASNKNIGPIISVNVNTVNNSNLILTGNQVEYSLKGNYSKKTDSKLWCAQWKRSNQTFDEWTNSGCNYMHYDPIKRSYKCLCNNFRNNSLSLLLSLAYTNLNTTNEKLAKPSKLSFNIVNSMIYLGIFLSTIGILATIITFLIFKSERHGLVHKCLIILSTCLLMTNVLYVANSFLNLSNCVLVGALLHYFSMTSFMQLVTLSCAQYITLTRIFDYKIDKFFLKSTLFTFGMPIFIPIVVLSLEPHFYFNTLKSQCWLMGPPLYILYIIPVSLMLLINIGFLMAIFICIFRKPIQYYDRTKYRFKQALLSIVNCFLMSITWLVSYSLVLDTNGNDFNGVFEIIFCVCLVVHGHFIFLFHIFLCKSKKNLLFQNRNKHKFTSLFELINKNNESSKQIFTIMDSTALKPRSTSFDSNINSLSYLYSNSNKERILSSRKKNKYSFSSKTSFSSSISYLSQKRKELCNKLFNKRRLDRKNNFDKNNDVPSRIDRLNDSFKRIKYKNRKTKLIQSPYDFSSQFNHQNQNTKYLNNSPINHVNDKTLFIKSNSFKLTHHFPDTLFLD